MFTCDANTFSLACLSFRSVISHRNFLHGFLFSCSFSCPVEEFFSRCTVWQPPNKNGIANCCEARHCLQRYFAEEFFNFCSSTAAFFPQFISLPFEMSIFNWVLVQLPLEFNLRPMRGEGKCRSIPLKWNCTSAQFQVVDVISTHFYHTNAVATVFFLSTDQFNFNNLSSQVFFFQLSTRNVQKKNSRRNEKVSIFCLQCLRHCSCNSARWCDWRRQ